MAFIASVRDAVVLILVVVDDGGIVKNQAT